MLGPPDLRFGGTAVALPAKSQALLISLTLPGARARREVLADMFWGDSGEDGARANLRLALTRIRQAMPSVLDPDAETVGLVSTAMVQVDALQRMQTVDTLHEQPAEALEVAVALYRGPFLQDFSCAIANRLKTGRHCRVPVCRRGTERVRPRMSVRLPVRKGLAGARIWTKCARVSLRLSPGRFRALTTLQLTVDSALFLALDPVTSGPQVGGLATRLAKSFLLMSTDMAIFAPRRFLYTGATALILGQRVNAGNSWREGIDLCADGALRYDRA